MAMWWNLEREVAVAGVVARRGRSAALPVAQVRLVARVGAVGVEIVERCHRP